MCRTTGASKGRSAPNTAAATVTRPAASAGIARYFSAYAIAADQSKAGAVAIEFDGVYDYSEVWVNGQFVGGRPYGFSSFQFDLTPFVKFGADDNLIAVRVDHSRFADSRFYTGSGIYRNVRLVITDKLRIAHWGVSVTAPKITSDSAVVRIETTVENGSADKREFSLQSDIVAPGGEIVASLTTSKSAAGNSVQTLVQEMKILQAAILVARFAVALPVEKPRQIRRDRRGRNRDAVWHPHRDL